MIDQDLLDLLEDNMALRTLLGGAGRILPGHIQKGQDLPCVTVDFGGETSEKEVGYNSSKKRDNQRIATVEVWTQTSIQHRAQICELLDELLLPDPLEGTWGWAKISDSRPWDEPLRAYHATMRYVINYTVLDA